MMTVRVRDYMPTCNSASSAIARFLLKLQQVTLTSLLSSSFSGCLEVIFVECLSFDLQREGILLAMLRLPASWFPFTINY